MMQLSISYNSLDDALSQLLNKYVQFKSENFNNVVLFYNSFLEKFGLHLKFNYEHFCDFQSALFQNEFGDFRVCAYLFGEVFVRQMVGLDQKQRTILIQQKMRKEGVNFFFFNQMLLDGFSEHRTLCVVLQHCLIYEYFQQQFKDQPDHIQKSTQLNSLNIQIDPRPPKKSEIYKDVDLDLQELENFIKTEPAKKTQNVEKNVFLNRKVIKKVPLIQTQSQKSSLLQNIYSSALSDTLLVNDLGIEVEEITENDYQMNNKFHFVMNKIKSITHENEELKQMNESLASSVNSNCIFQPEPEIEPAIEIIKIVITKYNGLRCRIQAIITKEEDNINIAVNQKVVLNFGLEDIQEKELDNGLFKLKVHAKEIWIKPEFGTDIIKQWLD
ncbi:Hypothetical_protein [Hexamita inflata]|uniref:Hypothetical_protein n=1 Tax=Hexamita inflata TaxID=28002 RepID=A0AA86U936_9EUKA|nr:Hypothetical protein HINF_LOCUS29837 [Hexamita inflata]